MDQNFTSDKNGGRRRVFGAWGKVCNRARDVICGTRFLFWPSNLHLLPPSPVPSPSSSPRRRRPLLHRETRLGSPHPRPREFLKAPTPHIHVAMRRSPAHSRSSTPNTAEWSIPGDPQEQERIRLESDLDHNLANHSVRLLIQACYPTVICACNGAR